MNRESNTTKTIFLFAMLGLILQVPFTHAGERVMQPKFGVDTQKAKDQQPISVKGQNSPANTQHPNKTIRQQPSAPRGHGHEEWINVESVSLGSPVRYVKIQGKQLLTKDNNNMVKPAMSGRYYLTDGRLVHVSGGRITSITRHNRSRTVGGSRAESVGANKSENVGGSRSEQIGAKKQEMKAAPGSNREQGSGQATGVRRHKPVQ